MVEKRGSFFPSVIVTGVAFFAVIGLIFGVISAKNSPEAYEIIKATELFSGAFWETWKNAFLQKGIITALISLSGVSILLLPVPLIAIAVKGYSYGFTAGCVVASWGIRGYFLTLSGLLIQNLLYLLLSIFYSSYGINKSIGTYLNRRNYEYRVKQNKSFLLVTAAAFILVCLISFAEAFISVTLYEI